MAQRELRTRVLNRRVKVDQATDCASKVLVGCVLTTGVAQCVTEARASVSHGRASVPDIADGAICAPGACSL